MELNKPREEIKFVTFHKIGVIKPPHSLGIIFSRYKNDPPSQRRNRSFYRLGCTRGGS